MKNIALFILLVSLSGCASHQNLVLQGSGSTPGSGSGSMILGHTFNGHIIIDILDKHFEGQWIIDRKNKTPMGFDAAQGSSIDLVGMGVSQTFISFCNGTALLTSGDGTLMKCFFQVGDSLGGHGFCGTSDGKLYDLLIR